MNSIQEGILRNILKELGKITKILEDQFVFKKQRVKESPNDPDFIKDDPNAKPESMLK